METNISQGQLRPTSALVVYERRNERGDLVDMEEEGLEDLLTYYVETHSIHATPEGRYRLGEGSPITYEAVGRLAHAFSRQAADLTPVTGLLPENLLAVHQSPGKLDMLWYDKPQKRNLLYYDGSVLFNAPAMLYHLRDGNLTVYATDAEGRPDNKTRLYTLPWSNMHGGHVCMGSAQFKRHSPTYRQNVEEWTSGFWMSTFGMSRSWEEIGLLHKLAKEDAPYPVKDLRFVQTFGQMASRL